MLPDRDSYLATVPTSREDPEDGEGPIALEVTHFSKKKVLKDANGKLWGQWHRTFKKACRGAPTTFIHKDSIQEIFDCGPCEDGDVIVCCTHF